MSDQTIDTAPATTPHDLRPSNVVPLGDVLGLERGPGSAGNSSDGRTLRRTRNREAVINALIDLVREGSLEPSVAAIADRAAVSHRSVFRYFDDLNDLVRTAIDYEVRKTLPMATIEDVGLGSIERRVDALVDSRLRVYAHTYQLGRVARLRSAAIPAIDEGLRVISDLMRTQLRNHFQPELSQFPDADAEFALDAAMIVVGFESYDTHRRMFEHGNERIRLVWNNALLALFGR